MLWRVDHSPLGSPFIDTKVPLKYGSGLDYLGDVIANAINWEMIEVAGAWYLLPFAEKDGKFIYSEIPKEKAEQKTYVKLQGEETVVKWFSEHPDEFKVLDNQIRSLVFG